MSGTAKGIARSIKSRQIGTTLISVSVNGTAATPVAGGMDARFIGSVVDNGAGDYTINLAAGLAGQADIVPVAVIPSTAGIIPSVSAVTKSSIRVVCENDAGVATDADLIITFFHRTYGTNL